MDPSVFESLDSNVSTVSSVKSVPLGVAVVVLNTVIPHLLLAFSILGLIGFVGNLLTFLQPALRSNSCCLYTLASSCVDIVHLSINVFPDYLTSRYGTKLLWGTSTAWCRLYFFLYSFLPQLSINWLLLSIIDRYACTCPLTSRLHRLNQLRVVPLLMAAMLIVSSLLSIYGPILAYRGPLTCGYRHAQLYGILNICINGLLQPLVMLTFAWLTYRNVRQSRQRVGVRTTNSNRFRNQFIAMMIAQVLITAVLSLQWMIGQTYVLFNSNRIKTLDDFLTMTLFLSFTISFYSLNSVKSFYSSMITSRFYRQTFVRGVRKCLHR